QLAGRTRYEGSSRQFDIAPGDLLVTSLAEDYRLEMLGGHRRPRHGSSEQANPFCILWQVGARQEKAAVDSVDTLALMNTATHGAAALTVRLGSLEELVWLYDQTSPFHFVMGATFVGAGAAAPWREVLDALQWRHPLLRVRIERDASAHPKFVTDE